MPNIGDVGDVIEGGVTGALSEFWDELYQIILSDLYKTAYEGCQKSFDGLFDSLNTHVSEAAVSLNQTPESWNASAYWVPDSIPPGSRRVPCGGICVGDGADCAEYKPVHAAV